MLSRTILPAFARLLSFLVPSRHWYRCAHATGAVLAWWPRSFGSPSGPPIFEQALFLNRLLAKLSCGSRPFPAPWRWDAASEAAVRKARDSGRGAVFYSAHLPLVKIAIRALIESGLGPDAAIAAKPEPDGCIPIWGLTQRLPAFLVRADVLLKTRTLLRRGGSAVLLVDTRTGEYSPNIFKLAGITGATVICFSAELEPDRTIAVKFFLPPHPECRDGDQIRANLFALDHEVSRISGRQPPGGFDRIPASRLT